MKCVHRMPFGAEWQGDGARFRLWAPAARSVLLCLDEGRLLPMSPDGAGFFQCTTAAARPGSRYGFRIDDSDLVLPDPASRFNPDDVHAPSELIDPEAFHWDDDNWQGRRWEEAVVYELHVGAFTPEGTFAAVEQRLDALQDLGITVVELMPIADFPGRRNWGYDGVLPFAPDSAYGRPENLKRLVQAAHRRGLMVMLDVVYNHFGPDGNYLHLYAPQFFTERHLTPWGAAIDFEAPSAATVRQFFIQNALYWLREYRFDGLRLDAAHAICDDSRPDILTELATAVRREFLGQRRVHLVLENDHNAAHYLARDGGGGPRWYDAQWNDDYHHALHALLTGEEHGYYADYAADPLVHLARALTEGFAYQGEPSAFRGGVARGEPSADLPSGAFVHFLQNHDQVGNRAGGERIAQLAPPEALRAAYELLLLAPQPPLIFMGEEIGACSPFPFFCDFATALGEQVAEGRRREFARFPEFRDPEAQQRIPHPNRAATFAAAVLSWNGPASGALLRAAFRKLLALRRKWLHPRLPASRGRYQRLGPRALTCAWELADGSRWHCRANLGREALGALPRMPGRLIHATGSSPTPCHASQLPAWSVAWYLED